jgi:hypothetical protein
MNEETRARTQRRSKESHLDVSGAVALGFYEKTFQILSQDASNALKRPWHKLERGLRIGRLREYVARETERLTLVAEDSDALFKLLLKGLDRKMLSSKAAVTYEVDKEQITEIKGLVAHTASTGRTKYQLLEKKSGTTQKKRTVPKETTPTTNSELDGNGSKNEAVTAE